MKKSFAILFSLFAMTVSAQEPVAPAIPAEPVIPAATPALPPSIPVQPPYQPSGAGLPRVNPAVLLKMRNDLSFELQNVQRTLGLIDPNDAELKKTLTEQQAELVSQLKDINTQMQAQGLAADGDVPALPGQPGVLPTAPKKADTLMGGGVDANNWLIQQQLQPQRPAPRYPGMGSGIEPGSLAGLPPNFSAPNPARDAMPQTPPGYMPYTPQPIDQERAWANSAWGPQPTKELTDLKQTVESLRTEISTLKESVKALETQIQLLNRNILLSQPKQ